MQNCSAAYVVDDVEQLVKADNPAYKLVPKHDQKPIQEEDQAYSNTDISQQGEVVTSGKLGFAGIAPRAAASDKWNSFFALQCQQVNHISEWEWIKNLKIVSCLYQFAGFRCYIGAQVYYIYELFVLNIFRDTYQITM